MATVIDKDGKTSREWKVFSANGTEITAYLYAKY